jgi:Flp pilus assembly protein TadB
MNNHQTIQLSQSQEQQQLSRQEQLKYLSMQRTAILTSKAFSKWQKDIRRELKRIQNSFNQQR